VIAVGSRPYRPADLDFDHPRIRDSDTILKLDHTPEMGKADPWDAGENRWFINLKKAGAAMFGDIPVRNNNLPWYDAYLAWFDRWLRA